MSRSYTVPFYASRKFAYGLGLCFLNKYSIITIGCESLIFRSDFFKNPSNTAITVVSISPYNNNGKISPLEISNFQCLYIYWCIKSEANFLKGNLRRRRQKEWRVRRPSTRKFTTAHWLITSQIPSMENNQAFGKIPANFFKVSNFQFYCLPYDPNTVINIRQNCTECVLQITFFSETGFIWNSTCIKTKKHLMKNLPPKLS